MKTFEVIYKGDNGSKSFGAVEADSSAAAILQVLSTRYSDRSKDDLDFLAGNMSATEVKAAPKAPAKGKAGE